jgi:dTDP-4-amino-4,6-dideoxygalactose transaminase
MYPVTKPVLPDLRKYGTYLEKVHDRAWLTNFGPLHEELTDRLKDVLAVRHLLLVANGTLALQVAYRALDVRGSVLTTPFSFIATTSSMAWEGLQPLFIDIDQRSLNLDPRLLDGSPPASAIVPVHVYGNPCDVDAIGRFAEERSMRVIYDAAHAFGSKLNGQSVLRHGDASTLSFHATKVFHTAEGGAIIFRDEAAYRRARSMINFGLEDDQPSLFAGINAKLSEYHAAIGLTLLDGIEGMLQHRAQLVHDYKKWLSDYVEFQQWHAGGSPNGAYMPILLSNEEHLCALASSLAREGIQTRRYFHPSLNRLAWTQGASICKVSEDVAARVLCLPLYAELTRSDVQRIAERVQVSLG